jgi:hypothetical protein
MTITNAQIAQEISNLVDKWRTRDLEFVDWLNGAADGGPFGDGRFPLTDYLGVVQYIKSPAALQSSVTGSADASASSAAAAAASVLSALAAQAAAEGARDLALGYRDAAQAARDLALTYRDDAANSAANALVHRNAAASSATAAAGSATDANDSAADAADYAGAAASSASAAASSAAAAAASAAAAATFDPAGFYTKTAADARYRQLSVAITDADIADLAYSKLTSVPSTFAPSAHTHPASDITGTINAETLGGLSLSASATANSVAQRDSVGILTASDMYSVGGFRWSSDTNFYIYNTSGYSYGSWRINGARNGYVGLVLDIGHLPTLMSNGGDTVGVYLQGASFWSWFDDGSEFRVSHPIVDYNSEHPYARFANIGNAGGGRIYVQNGGSPSGTQEGDITFIW